jgi:hypothetical protein
VHHVSDSLAAAKAFGLVLNDLQEWWRLPDRVGAPLLISLMFSKQVQAMDTTAA